MARLSEKEAERQLNEVPEDKVAEMLRYTEQQNERREAARLAEAAIQTEAALHTEKRGDALTAYQQWWGRVKQFGATIAQDIKQGVQTRPLGGLAAAVLIGIPVAVGVAITQGGMWLKRWRQKKRFARERRLINAGKGPQAIARAEQQRKFDAAQEKQHRKLAEYEKARAAKAKGEQDRRAQLARKNHEGPERRGGSIRPGSMGTGPQRNFG